MNPTEPPPTGPEKPEKLAFTVRLDAEANEELNQLAIQYQHSRQGLAVLGIKILLAHAKHTGALPRIPEFS